ncbi:bi-domain-containing oxidoreductase [Rhabdaerophilum calidifontis]|uniref:bi-domain-containing oxidoreductase n=1 Tax=Rhabdaerophilum calidifontis TaxID=2604328 RepID=UPI0012391C59|nr:bi-domain-containing oxidoreductase [Rhabdaerophilum calidifontis]
MKQVVIQPRAGVSLAEVPAPGIEPGRVLVRVGHSCVSVGTEMSGIRALNRPLWKRAIDKSGDLQRLIAHARENGIAQTRALVDRKLKALQPLGYSAAGTVIGIGAGITGIREGDRVACGGSDWAHHAGFVNVPENLCVLVPDGLAEAEASTVTLGAIALQGVRRAAPTIGETFLVSGLGILGQLACRLLHANGVRVIGVDPLAARRDLALRAGAAHVLDPAAEDVAALAARLTGGHGVDGVLVAAATRDPGVLAAACGACRRKGRVVVIGDVALAVDRGDVYAKELDLLISTSYGPGRYDRRYEEEGLDYPLGFVRWTENRNMAAYLDLLAAGRVNIADLIATPVPVEEAAAAYRRLQEGGDAPLMVLFRYPEAAAPARIIPVAAPVVRRARTGQIGLGLIGAGGFATGTLLPLIAAERDRFRLTTIVTRQGLSAVSTARQFGGLAAATDPAALLDDPETEAVLIATRHHLHAGQVLAAIEAGRHVFVEKPLCLTEEELARIEAALAPRDTPGPVLMTGFNRRFSPPIRQLSTALRHRKGPMMIDLRVNAGYLAPETWVHGPEGGGRNIGEACHFYDLFTALTGAPVQEIRAMAIGDRSGALRPDDNFSAQIRFEDGSLAVLTYTALGDARFPKERMEIFCDGRVYSLDNYTALSSSDGRLSWRAPRPEKGHREELRAFHTAITAGGDWPIPLWEQAQAMRIAFAIQRQITA